MQYEFEWNLDKAKQNLKKHKVSFPIAATVFLDQQRIERSDNRDDYGEDRWIVIGKIEGETCLVVVYAMRGDSIRLISARKAEKHEEDQYQTFNGQI